MAMSMVALGLPACELYTAFTYYLLYFTFYFFHSSYFRNAHCLPSEFTGRVLQSIVSVCPIVRLFQL